MPPPKDSFTVVADADKLNVSWEKPPGKGHAFLESYKILVKNAEGQVLRETTVPRQQTTLTIEDNMIVSGTQYTVAVASVCKDTTNFIDATGDLMKLDNLESASAFLEKTVVTKPLAPANLKLESAASTSIKIKWDAPPHIPPQGKLTYALSIIPESPEVRRAMMARVDERNKEVESTVFQFSHLPEIVGTGEKYRVTVCSVFTPVVGAGPLTSYTSHPVTEIFTTKPLPPEKLNVKDHNKQIFSWLKSPSPAVTHYKLKIKKENEKAVDYFIEDNDDRSQEEKQVEISYKLPLELENGVEYKVNIFSEAETRDGWIESEPLFSKITKQEDMAINTDTDLEIENDVFDAGRNSRIVLKRRTTKPLGERPVSVSRNASDVKDTGLPYSRQSSLVSNDPL